MAFKKNIKTKLLALSLTVAMAGSLCACGGGGYMGPVNDLMSTWNKRETDPIKLATVMQPSFSEKDLQKTLKLLIEMNDDTEDSLDKLVDKYEDAYEECDDEFEKYKISFEKKEAEKLKDKKVKDYAEVVEEYFENNIEDGLDLFEDILEDEDDLEDFADEMDLDEKETKKLVKAAYKYMSKYEELKVTDGYEVKGKFILKSGKDTYETDTVKFIVLKINGSWVYWGLIDTNNVKFEDDDEEVFSRFYSMLNSKKFYSSYMY